MHRPVAVLVTPGKYYCLGAEETSESEPCHYECKKYRARGSLSNISSSRMAMQSAIFTLFSSNTTCRRAFRTQWSSSCLAGRETASHLSSGCISGYLGPIFLPRSKLLPAPSGKTDLQSSTEPKVSFSLQIVARLLARRLRSSHI